MKLEKLRNSSRKKVIIGLSILLAITSSLILSISLAKFKNTESIPLAKGTINYSGADFSMVAIKISEDKENYTDSDTIPISGYTLNTEKSTCTIGGTVKEVPMEYKVGSVYIKVNEKNTKCNLYFDKLLVIETKDIIASLNATTQTDSVPNFANAATSNEGVFKTSDGIYGDDTYYWRGAVDNNHVIFADMCWRIIRINGDGSIRMIYNGVPTGGVCKQASDATSIAVTSQTYNENYGYSYYVGWTYADGLQRPTYNSAGSPSNIMTQTDLWYKTNIADKGYDTQVAVGKFCNDRNTASGNTWKQNGSRTFYYAGYNRRNGKPVTTCPEADIYEMKAGAITMDEVIMAGGKWGIANSSYYLYNTQYYWTMSPYHWDSSSYAYANVFSVNSDGALGNNTVSWHTPGIRPVINLRADVTFKPRTNGTSSNPYVAL